MLIKMRISTDIYTLIIEKNIQIINLLISWLKICFEKILIFFFNKILTIIRYIQILKNLHYLWDEFNTIYKEFIH